MKLVEEGVANDKKSKRGDKKSSSDSDPAAAPAVPVGPPPEVGIIYRDCPIVGVHNFGVFVQVLPGHEGLVHISELDTKRVSL